MKLIKILKYLDKKFPEKSMAAWDKSGLQIYDQHLKIDPNQEIKKVFVAIDLTKDSLQQALAEKSDLIITRHPFIFNELASERNNPQKSQMIKQLLQTKTLIYSIHTNYDVSPNNNLISLLNHQMEIKKSNYFGADKAGVLIKLKQSLTPQQFRKSLMNVFPNQHFSHSKNWSERMPIQEFYLVPGAGGDWMLESSLTNAIFVTGELKWHHWLYALDNNVQVLTLGHEMENHFTDHLANLLKNAYSDLTITTYQQTSPFSAIASEA